MVSLVVGKPPPSWPWIPLRPASDSLSPFFLLFPLFCPAEVHLCLRCGLPSSLPLLLSFSKSSLRPGPQFPFCLSMCNLATALSALRLKDAYVAAAGVPCLTTQMWTSLCLFLCPTLHHQPQCLSCSSPHPPHLTILPISSTRAGFPTGFRVSLHFLSLHLIVMPQNYRLEIFPGCFIELSPLLQVVIMCCLDSWTYYVTVFISQQ